MKLVEIKYNGQDCYACYITSYDYEEFNDLRLAKKHIEFRVDKRIFYVITDKDGNTIRKKQMQ